MSYDNNPYTNPDRRRSRARRETNFSSRRSNNARYSSSDRERSYTGASRRESVRLVSSREYDHREARPQRQYRQDSIHGHDHAYPSLSKSRRAPSGYRLKRGARPRRRLTTNVVTTIVGIVVVAVMAIGGILIWSNRAVDIKLNGETVSTRVGSTLDQVIKEKKVETKSGNLISVEGEMLEQGMGYSYLAKLNGAEMDGPTTAAYRVSPGDELTIENGRDRTEDYDVQIVEEQPKLEMAGEAWGSISYISQWPSIGKKEMRTGRRSGKTAQGDIIQETKNAIVKVHQIKPEGDRKLIALTFDDGPSDKYTEKYLEILNKYNIHATFFNLGNNVNEYPHLSKKVIEQGSEIMSHSQSHPQLSPLDSQSLQKQLSDSYTAIENATGVKTTSIRPPYGDFTSKAWLNSGGLTSLSVLWNQDSLDWKLPGVEAIVNNSLKGITSGSIILMHDGGGNRDQDVEALPQIIEKLKEEGYEFVTVSELMKSDSSIPADIASGNAPMPEGSTWPTEMASK